MTISAWYMDDEESDQRLTHRLEPNQPVPKEKLSALGVLAWEGLTGPEDPLLAKIRSERGYTYNDEVHVCPDKLPNYEAKIKNFYTEHIHYDEEIRYCVSGSGYFDVRDEDDKWIRVAVETGDMLILPEGIYHRFTCDSADYIHAMRLFVGEPIWTPYNREDIDEKKDASRQKYVEQCLKPLREASAIASVIASAIASDSIESAEDSNKRQKTVGEDDAATA